MVGDVVVRLIWMM